MKNRLLYDHHARLSKREEERSFRLFVLTQFVHWTMLFLFLLGGIFFIVFGLKLILP